MATRRKKPTPADLAGNADPRAPLDAAALLDAAKPLLKDLAADLLARADGSRAVTEALQARHAQEQKAERTADAYPEWRRGLVEQVAAAWLLSCVFVRTLEDRGLLGKNRIAGPGAQDSWKAFLQFAPSLSEREYLLTVFRELGRLPAAADLFDARHNPVWLLAPSAEGARKLLDVFRSPNADAPQFRFGGDDTRFLGDLYQDLSEDVRKRYALLQTPRFVESFILDRTLEPAIERFGLDDTNLIDPTCGSGHFLLGAFERLFDHRLRAQPGLSAREAATKALDAVAGSDINPYAVAIARFRLTLAFIEKCGLARLKDVPRLPLHLAVADSLLYNPQIGQLGLVAGTDPSMWEGSHFSLEDPKAARDVLFKQYAAVVGNPPYITPKDATLRRRYAELYRSCRMNYALTVPFAERFFQLTRTGGRTGMITANSFMKREFGKFLIEDYLPRVDLDLVVNTSGAFIPGHGTPTVLLFGTQQKPSAQEVCVVLANRGEPSTPSDPEQGEVWSAIANHWNDDGFESEYISVAKVARSTIGKHPWSLGGGGAAELKELLEERAGLRLSGVIEDVGFSVIIGEDEVFVRRASQVQGGDLPCLPLVIGEDVRDWALSPSGYMLRPFDEQTLEVAATGALLKELWPWKAILENRVVSGSTTMKQSGRQWFDVRRLSRDKQRVPRSIAFAFVATHNHFVLDDGGKVFNRTAPVIKLPETATEEDHLVLLAYLNSSTACFWMKQIFHNKSSASQKHHTDPARAAYEFTGTGLAALPIPALPRDEFVEAARRLSEHAASRVGWVSGSDFLDAARGFEWGRQSLSEYFESGWAKYDAATSAAAYLQEEIDWAVYRAYGLLDGEVEIRLNEDLMAPLGTRPFEVATGYDSGVSERVKDITPAAPNADDGPTHWANRTKALQGSELRLLESRENKRMWRDTEQNISSAQFRREAAAKWLADFVATTAERAVETGSAVRRLSEVQSAMEPVAALGAIAELLEKEAPSLLVEQLATSAVPFLAAHRYSDAGLETWGQWNAAWEAQREEDLGHSVDNSSPPPKYEQEDFRSSSYWSLRGKLDVPKERFISYPGCESDENKEHVYGWAGWDHLQRAVALAGLYQDRKQREGWTKDRLLPMLAGLLELLPWLKQWHHEPSAELGGERPSDQFEAFLNAECGEFGFTHDDLRAWRPAPKGRGAKPKATKKRGSGDAEAEA
jgi:hypothetical protein